MAKTGVTALTAFIGYDTSESTVVDCGTRYVVGLVMSDVWTTAPVTVMVSLDGAVYYDLFERTPDRTSLTETVFGHVPNAMVAINPNRLLMGRYLKLRSGTSNDPIKQQQTCSFLVVTVDGL